MKKKQDLKKDVKLQVKDFASKKPALFIVIIIIVVIVLFRMLSSLEILPERPMLSFGKSVVIEKGDSFNWIGMQVIGVSRSIKKEFNIPSRIKGMFVLDEGIGSAKKYGVKTGDVIISIGRRPVPNARVFVKIADSVQYYEGILLDIYRDGDTLYITVPFEYQYGPIAGPNKKSWQLGAPLLGQRAPYGPIVNNNNNQNR